MKEKVDYEKLYTKNNFFKNLYVSTMLFAVGRAYETAYSLDKRLQKEFSILPIGFCFELCVHPKGPRAFIYINEKHKISYSKKFHKEADIQMKFRNLDRAFTVFTFKIGANQSFAQNGLLVSGDLPITMIFMRTLAIVESYLLPDFITKNILRELVKFPFLQRSFVRICAYLHIVIGIVTFKWHR